MAVNTLPVLASDYLGIEARHHWVDISETFLSACKIALQFFWEVYEAFLVLHP